MLAILREKELLVIDFIRKEEQVNLLKEQGADFVLNINDEAFTDQLTQCASELNATAALY